MQNEILRKLTMHLSEPLQSEPDVVYLFVKLRKLLDQMPADKQKKFLVLRMHCDWIVHNELSREGKDKVLEGLDKVIHKPGDKLHFDIFGFVSLRDDLSRFLEDQGLPRTIETEDEQWGQLLRCYISAISDCPLEFGKKIKNLQSATPQLLRLPEGPEFENCIAMNWRLVFRDGATQNRPMTFSF